MPKPVPETRLWHSYVRSQYGEGKTEKNALLMLLGTDPWREGLPTAEGNVFV